MPADTNHVRAPSDDPDICIHCREEWADVTGECSVRLRIALDEVRTENQRLQTALSHAVDAGFVAVNEKMAERDVARADLALCRSRLSHIIAALRVAPALDVPGDPAAARLCAHIEADRMDMARAGDEMMRLARERDEARTRVAELERHVGSLHKAAAAGRDAERARVLALVRFNRNPACPSSGVHMDADELIADIEDGKDLDGEGL